MINDPFSNIKSKVLTSITIIVMVVIVATCGFLFASKLVKNKSMIQFGHYAANNNEELYWFVIAEDEDSYTLLSSKIIDVESVNPCTEDDWDISSLEIAFTDEEKDRLLSQMSFVDSEGEQISYITLPNIDEITSLPEEYQNPIMTTYARLKRDSILYNDMSFGTSTPLSLLGIRPVIKIKK